MENDNYEIHVLSKVVPTIETVVLNMLPSCQDDLCPLRPQLYTSWTGGILAGKIPLRRDKCLAKVVPTGCQKNWFAFKSPANGPQTKVGLFSNPLFQPFRWGFWLWRCSPTSPNVCLSVCVWSIWKYAFLHTLDYLNQNSMNYLLQLCPRQIWLFYWCTQVKAAL